MIDYLDKLENASRFIEEHLGEDLPLEDVAKIAGIAPFHFHRIFSAVIGEPVATYVRRRKLTESALCLTGTDKSILDIALSFGFESHEGFSRAFRKNFGISPSTYRKRGVHPFVYLRPAFSKTELSHYTNGVSHQPRILKMPDLHLMGLALEGEIRTEEIIKHWQKLARLLSKTKHLRDSGCFYGISDMPVRYDLTTTSCSNKFSYFAGIENDKPDAIPELFQNCFLDGQLYAVFEHRGPLQDLGLSYQYIYGTWLIRSGYGLARSPELQVFTNSHKPLSPSAKVEIRIPIEEVI